LQAVVDAVAAGRVKSIVTQRRPFAQVNEALADLRSGRVLGRLVRTC
jgi:D-arabinose 1-dehydrogenase-like Zn-dependent alcohol dehydrogenase